MDASTETKPGNGKPALLHKSDIVEVGLIGVYLVQKLGSPTLGEIKSAGEKHLSCTMDGRTLSRALRGASKRGFICVEQAPTEASGGMVEKVYGMKNLSWKQPPEYAHISDLYPRLLQTEEGVQIKRFFDGTEKQTESKQSRGNVVDDYVAFRVTGVTLDPLLGSQIHCPQTTEARKRSGVQLPSMVVNETDKKDKKDSDVPAVEGIFVVDELTGEYLIPTDVLQGWVATNITRPAGLPDARAAYVAFSPVRIKPKRPTVQLVLPVSNARSGPAAPKSYEAIQAGEEIVINFIAPTKGMFSPEQWEKAFILAGLYARRGLSPARGKRYGHFVVTKFENLGPVKDGDLNFVLGSVPKALLDQHGDYLKKALGRLKDVPLTGSFVSTGSDETPDFPGTEDDADD